jgi:hypothetical protein
MPQPCPDSVFIGPKAVLLDENSGSDGDIFPWMFRTAKLGPLIGERSWGGVVGIISHGQVIDGGDVNVPEFAYATAEGQWAVEGHGVDPAAGNRMVGAGKERKCCSASARRCSLDGSARCAAVAAICRFSLPPSRRSAPPLG